MIKYQIFICLLLSFNTNGQFSYGIRAGINSSNQYWDLKVPFGSKGWRDNRTGLVVYLTGEKTITGYLSFKLEIGYVQKGFVNDFVARLPNGDLSTKNRDNVLFHNLSSNLSFKLNFTKSKFKPYIISGLHFDYLMGYEDIVLDLNGQDLKLYSFVIEDFNKLTIAGLLGVGFEYNQTFFMELEYNQAITNNINDEEYLVYDRSIALTVGLNISKLIVSKKQKAKNKKYRQKSR